MPFLEQLRGFEVFVAGRKVSAGILPVGIEEKVVEIARQIVVVRHVAPRAIDRVVMPEGGQPAVDQPLGFAEISVIADVPIGFHVNLDEIAQAALFDQQAPVHIGFAPPDRTAGGELTFGAFVRHPQDDRRSLPIADIVTIALGIDQRDLAVAHKTPHYAAE